MLGASRLPPMLEVRRRLSAPSAVEERRAGVGERSKDTTRLALGSAAAADANAGTSSSLPTTLSRGAVCQGG
jgi:hypothetical protein